MKKYLVYGLVFESQISLSPLKEIAENLSTQVKITLGDVTPDGLESPVESKALTQIAANKVWMNIPNIARFLITDGCNIAVDSYEKADEQSIGVYIMGSCMGAILHQRGFLVLHANAIKIGVGENTGAVLIAGISGAGKSTTAATFHQRGFDIISDDVVAMDEQQNIIGGFPQIKLWEDALEHLNIAKENLKPIRMEINKFSFPLLSKEAEQDIPVKAIYILNAANERKPNEFNLEVLSGMDKFMALKNHTYRKAFMEGLGLKTLHLNMCSQLASKVHMARVIRPTIGFNAPQLVNYVLDDLESAGLYSRDSYSQNPIREIDKDSNQEIDKKPL